MTAGTADEKQTMVVSTDTKYGIDLKDIFLLPNLLSLSRVLLAPAIIYFIAGKTEQDIIIGIILMAVAGFSDYFDGFFARRRGQISQLGIILDPLADKIFAAALIIALLRYREFPLWMAAAVIARDLLIIFAGSLLLGKKRPTLPSNLTGKYYFASLALLIFSYVVIFPSGEKIFLIITSVLLIASSINYSRLFYKTVRGEELQVFKDRLVYKIIRSAATVLACLYGLVRFYQEVILRMFR
jgi:cardiolipin synthase